MIVPCNLEGPKDLDANGKPKPPPYPFVVSICLKTDNGLWVMKIPCSISVLLSSSGKIQGATPEDVISTYRNLVTSGKL